jgi:hypothetical protein
MPRQNSRLASRLNRTVPVASLSARTTAHEGLSKMQGAPVAVHSTESGFLLRCSLVWLLKWFYDTFIGTVSQEQLAVVLLLEGALISWLLAMREYGEHEDLRGSGRRSVIPYVHG